MGHVCPYMPMLNILCLKAEERLLVRKTKAEERLASILRAAQDSGLVRLSLAESRAVSQTLLRELAH